MSPFLIIFRGASLLFVFMAHLLFQFLGFTVPLPPSFFFFVGGRELENWFIPPAHREKKPFSRTAGNGERLSEFSRKAGKSVPLFLWEGGEQ